MWLWQHDSNKLLVSVYIFLSDINWHIVQLLKGSNDAVVIVPCGIHDIAEQHVVHSVQEVLKRFLCCVQLAGCLVTAHALRKCLAAFCPCMTCHQHTICPTLSGKQAKLQQVSSRLVLK